MSDRILSLISTCDDFQRFVIADPESKFWTGDRWSDVESAARLYANLNDAGRAIQELLLLEHGHKPKRRFVAEICLDLYSDFDLSPHEISDWLVKTARLTIDTGMHGNGPKEGTLGLTHIDWNQLREIEGD